MKGGRASSKGIVLVVGAGDYIGAAISRRFASGGFTVCMGRRNGDKLAPLVEEIEAGGGEADGSAPARLHLLHRRHRERAWRQGLRRIRQRQVRTARPRPEHGAGARTGEHSGGPPLIDAGVDTEWVRNMIRERRGTDPDALPPDTLMKPSSIAEAYWALHNQTRDGWTFELDLRPFAETW